MASLRVQHLPFLQSILPPFQLVCQIYYILEQELIKYSAAYYR